MTRLTDCLKKYCNSDTEKHVTDILGLNWQKNRLIFLLTPEKNRWIIAYTAQQGLIPIYKKAQQWQLEKLNRKQLTWVKEIKDTVEILSKITTEILILARDFEKRIINKLLRKDDAVLF